MSRPKTIRCAIYTRKSTDEGLEQDFNSLDAQREAAEAYIKSQKHEGWEVIPTFYDDGGFSGGNMDRPALKKLLDDIKDKKIDIVVVYKVDRLSRALSDFAKMVEIFDAHNVSFVSVTQQFNTTTSMGRLTLNVLLSFAQFEREVTGERIRDKVAASKKKGMWMGGPQPLGYDVKDRKLIINKPEAEIIRFIYEYYLSNKKGEPLWKLLDILRSKGWRNKSYTSKKGNNIVGKEFKLNHIYLILQNPIYNGKIRHKGEIYNGEHKAIIDGDIWKAVQNKITSKDFMSNSRKKNSGCKLTGKIYDYLGNRMSPTYSYKYYADGRRYKMNYYVNREIAKSGIANSDFKRMRADHIDKTIESELTKIIDSKINELSASKNHDLISAKLKSLQESKVEPFKFLTKAVLYPDHIELCLADNETFNIEIHYKRINGKACLLEDGKQTDIEKEYCHPDDKTFAFIAKGFYWNKMIQDGTYKTIDQISKAQNHSQPYIKRALRQCYLAPDIINKILNPKAEQVDIERLTSVNEWCWKEQNKTIS